MLRGKHTQSATPTAVVVTFVYHVLDEAKDYANHHVQHLPGHGRGAGADRQARRARAATSSRSKIALFEGPDFTKIVNEITNLNERRSMANGGSDNDVVEIAELDNTDQLGR